MKKIILILVLILCTSCVTFKIKDSDGNSVAVSKDGVEVNIENVECFDSFQCSLESNGNAVTE